MIRLFAERRDASRIICNQVIRMFKRLDKILDKITRERKRIRKT